MGLMEFYKPLIVMIVLQFTYAAVSILTRASLLEGMNPRVFVFYRQAIATVVIAPIAYFSRYLNFSKIVRKIATKFLCVFWSFILVLINEKNVKYYVLLWVTYKNIASIISLYYDESTISSSYDTCIPINPNWYILINIQNITLCSGFNLCFCITEAKRQDVVLDGKAFRWSSWQLWLGKPRFLTLFTFNFTYNMKWLPEVIRLTYIKQGNKRIFVSLNSLCLIIYIMLSS